MMKETYSNEKPQRKKADWEIDFYSRPIIEKDGKQILKKIVKINNKFQEENLCDVSFVPNLDGIKN